MFFGDVMKKYVDVFKEKVIAKYGENTEFKFKKNEIEAAIIVYNARLSGRNERFLRNEEDIEMIKDVLLSFRKNK